MSDYVQMSVSWKTTEDEVQQDKGEAGRRRGDGSLMRKFLPERRRIHPPSIGALVQESKNVVVLDPSHRSKLAIARTWRMRWFSIECCDLNDTRNGTPGHRFEPR